MSDPVLGRTAGAATKARTPLSWTAEALLRAMIVEMVGADHGRLSHPAAATEPPLSEIQP